MKGIHERKGKNLMKEISFNSKSEFCNLVKHINKRGKEGIMVSESGMKFIKTTPEFKAVSKYVNGGNLKWMVENDKYRVGGLSIFYKGKVLKKRSNISFMAPKYIATIFSKKDENIYEVYFPLIEAYLIYSYIVNENTKSYSDVLDALASDPEAYKKILSNIRDEYNFTNIDNLKECVNLATLFGFEENSKISQDLEKFMEKITNEIVINESIAHIKTLFGREFVTNCSYNMSPKARRKVMLNEMAGSAVDLWGFLLEDLQNIGCDIMFTKKTSLIVSCTEAQAEKITNLSLKLQTNMADKSVILKPKVEKYLP